MPTSFLAALTLCVASLVQNVQAIGVIGQSGTKWDSNGQDINVRVPEGTRGGDLMVLAFHRTDDYLPIEINDGWKRVAECFKSDNGNDCSIVADCKTFSTKLGHEYCEKFKGGEEGNPETGGGDQTSGTGQDLCQVIYVKEASCDERSSYTFTIDSGHPAWVNLVTFRGVDTSNPVRSWASEGDDDSGHTKFPSVYAKTGDYLWLSSSHDDAVPPSIFGPPTEFDFVSKLSEDDEAGFVYGNKITSTGQTGTLETTGDGYRWWDKDLAITVAFRPGGSTVTCEGNGVVPEPQPDGECSFSEDEIDVKHSCPGVCGAVVWVDKAETCNDFCSSRGLQCSAAYDDAANNCVEKSDAPKIDCFDSLTKLGTTSDAVCECGDGNEVVPEPQPDGECSLTEDEIDVKHSCPGVCGAVVWTNKVDTCNDFCSSRGLQCSAAYDDANNNCVEKSDAPKIECFDSLTKLGTTSDAVCECGDALPSASLDRSDYSSACALTPISSLVSGVFAMGMTFNFMYNAA